MACKREKLEKGVKGRDQEGRGEGRGGALKGRQGGCTATGKFFSLSEYGDFRPLALRFPGPRTASCTGSSKSAAGRATARLPAKASRQGRARLCTRPSRHATRLLPNTRSVRQIVCLLVSYMPLGIHGRPQQSNCSSSRRMQIARQFFTSAPREPCAQQHCCSGLSMQQPPRASPETNGRPRPKLL